MEEASPVMAASWTLQKSVDDRASTIRMMRKFSEVGAPIAQMRSFSVWRCSDISEKKVEVEN